MKIFEKLANRFNTLTFILVILMFFLTFRMASLTIAQGEYYRDISDNKRLKEVYTTPYRGEIRDRYGRLLAGNVPRFTVQLLKDEINHLDLDVKNEGILNLVRYLEEDGVSYSDEFPIQLNTFKYKNTIDYLQNDHEPSELIVNIIIEKGLLPNVLDMFYRNNEYEEHYAYIAANKAIFSLKNKNIEVPINTKIYNNNVLMEFDTSKNVENWKAENNIPIDYGPKQALLKLINNDKAIIRRILEHPLARMMVFNLLDSQGFIGNIALEEYSISYNTEFFNQKINLMKSFPQITLESSAKEDFVNIFTEVSLSNFLERVIDVDGQHKIIPGEILISMLKDKGQVLTIELEISQDKNAVIYKYIGGGDIGDMSPKDILIEQSKNSGILPEYITSLELRPLAQEQLLRDGINPRISIAKDMEYVAKNNLEAWLTQNNVEGEKTANEVFSHIWYKYELDESLSKYEVKSILTIYDQLSKQGYLAYQPINLAYGIKESTVAKIEETSIEMPGVKISIEPVRYYPEGSTAAHMLGYLGKISQNIEIQKYIVEQNYSPSTIIGKTGIEESFEEYLSGEPGIKRVEVDVIGNTTNVIEEVKPIPGDNIYLSMDLDVQKKAEESLEQTLEKLQQASTYESPWGNYKFGSSNSKRRPYINAKSGAVVAIDVKTGQIIAMANYPSYDPNLFSTGISDSDWKSLFPEDDKNPLAPRPLYNIATQTAVQPGSTYKMVTALAALEKGLSPYTRIRDMGKVTIGTKTFNCWIYTGSGGTHGYVNLAQALRDSCNYYFYSLAMGENQKTGQKLEIKLEIEDIVNISKELGLNDKTGIEINVPAEVSGGVPDPQRKLINTKYLLRQLLNRDLVKYLKPETIKTDDDLKEIIEEIVTWIEIEKPLTRGEVIRRLDSLGIDPERRLPGERSGLADKIKFDYLNQAGWNITDTLNVTIGQGTNSYTPIQMANYIAIIANGGYKHKLSLIDSVKNYNNTKTIMEHESDPERINLNNYENLEFIKEGMRLASSDGSARRIFEKFPIEVGSKTGTAQRAGVNPYTGETFDEFAWFVGFAPYDDPEIAVAAVIFQGGSGGYAGPMVRDIIGEYLGLNDTETIDKLPYKNQVNID